MSDLNVRLSEKADEDISELANLLGCSKEQVINRSVSLFKTIATELVKGQKLFLASSDDTEEREVICSLILQSN